MASIKEGFDITLKEAFGGLKVCVWAVVLCVCYLLVKSNPGLGYTLSFVVGILLIGYLTQSEHNVVKKEGMLLPGLNVFSYGLIGLYTILVMAPFLIVSWGIWFLIEAFVKIPSPVWQQTVEVIGALFALSFTLTAHALFIRRLNPLDAFNVKKFCVGFGDIFISFSFLVVKLSIWAAIIVGFAAYLFTMFVGLENVIWQFFVSAYIVLTLFVAANYMAQLSEEIYVFMEKEENEKREQAAIEKLHRK